SAFLKTSLHLLQRGARRGGRMRTGGDRSERIAERPGPAQRREGQSPPLDELRARRGQVVQGDAGQRLGEAERRRPHGRAGLRERGATEDRRGASGRWWP